MGNSELRADGIYTWSIPALATKLADGRNLLTCPNAGACAQLCYARNGTYNFSNVKSAHNRNLQRVVDDPEQWFFDMNQELNKKKYRPTGIPREIDFEVKDSFLEKWLKRGGKAVRIHDSGDFFSEQYLELWVRIAEIQLDVLFYAYTKEVAMVKRKDLPNNFIVIFSMGGKQDGLIDVENDRHAEVFPNLDLLNEAGYTDQEKSDLLAVLLPTNKIGIVVNNIPHFKKKQGSATFGELQKTRG
jgi:hypothetical protein